MVRKWIFSRGNCISGVQSPTRTDSSEPGATPGLSRSGCLKSESIHAVNGSDHPLPLNPASANIFGGLSVSAQRIPHAPIPRSSRPVTPHHRFLSGMAEVGGGSVLALHVDLGRFSFRRQSHPPRRRVRRIGSARSGFRLCCWKAHAMSPMHDADSRERVLRQAQTCAKHPWKPSPQGRLGCVVLKAADLSVLQ